MFVKLRVLQNIIKMQQLELVMPAILIVENVIVLMLLIIVHLVFPLTCIWKMEFVNQLAQLENVFIKIN